MFGLGVLGSLSAFQPYDSARWTSVIWHPDTTIIDSLQKIIKALPRSFRDRYGDPLISPSSSSPFLLDLPKNIKTEFSLDPKGNFYNIDERLGGGFDFRSKGKIYFEDMKREMFKKKSLEGWHAISKVQDISEDSDQDSEDRLIPRIYLGPKAHKIFGSNYVDIRPNGRVVLDFSIQSQRLFNPQIPVLQQRTTNFLFDQQIQLNLVGKIGTKLSLNTNFDTKQIFDFQQLYKINFDNYDEFIFQDFDFGNIGFKTDNYLMSDLKNLFGISPKFRFGKLFLELLFATQRGRLETLEIKNGGQMKEFTIRASDYEINRHFFLSHFFRDMYETSLNAIPIVNSPIIVTRVEAYVTNRNNNTTDLQNICGFMDLGEARPHNTNLGNNTNSAATNDANNLYNTIKSDMRFRNADNIENELNTLSFSMVRGTDYEVLKGARKLSEKEYTFHKQLGYISLKTPLRNDEVLCVSFEYSYRGQAYKVGEMAEDYQKRGDSEIIFLKMISPSTIRTDLPAWDLMMKNIYASGAFQIQSENFQMRIIYRDDRTGIDNNNLHEGVNFTNVPLVQILGADKLNANGDVQSDGNYDFIEDITVSPQTGNLIFPVLEPFGSTLESNFTATEQALKSKYVYSDLYEKTQADAQLNTEKNKFYLVSSMKSGFNNVIQLPGINIAQNSVVIYSGGVRLTQGVDYRVDYRFGKVEILNQGVLNSGKPLKIQYEKSDLFNYQPRQLYGAKAKYVFHRDFELSSTFMHLIERPILSRIRIGEEPLKNTMLGFGGKYKTQSQLITRLIDKIPFLSTKVPSSLEVSGDAVVLIAGAPSLVGEANYYIDDFEGTEIAYSLAGRGKARWSLGSTPLKILEENSLLPESNELNTNFRRAHMAWYTIDNVFYSIGGSLSAPSNINDSDLRNHYVRLIPFNEVFPNKDLTQLSPPESSFDLAFYPSERGPYNYTQDVNTDGTLKDPEKNFASITSPILFNTDFDNINVQYLEFWLMDPFLDGQNGQVNNENNTTGGSLYINLGSISEDVIPDSRHYFENGLNSNATSYRESNWGRSPTQQYLTDSFSPEVSRNLQDIGFDGLADTDELSFFQNSFINGLNLNTDALQKIREDPSGDNFVHYLSNTFTANNGKILDRYKYFNGTEGNSAQSSSANFVLSSTNLPDNEDLNKDNTLSRLNQYYEYHVRLRKGMDVGDKYIVDKVVAKHEETNEQVTWYQFRIPIRDPLAKNVNNISDFKSIRFIRYFLTGWRQPVVLRFVGSQFTSSQWRPYTQSLLNPGLNANEERTSTNLVVSTVNIEENGQGDSQNIPYNLPPGFRRDFDRTSQVTRQMNEQSLQVQVEDLTSGDARAVFKNYNISLVNYKRIKMEIHAESIDASNGELRAFIRLGTDPNLNYYEVEIPLRLTPFGTSAAERDILWPRENELDIALSELVAVKKERDSRGSSLQLPYSKTVRSKYTVRVVGRPDLSSIQVILLGVRNPQTTSANRRSVTIWFNELRVSEFKGSIGWSTEASLKANLADFATVNASIRYSSAGFGGIQTRLSQRKRYESWDYSIASNINLHKFLFHKVGLNIPVYVSYEKSTSRPEYDTQDKDVPTDLVLSSFAEQSQKDEFLDKMENVTIRRSIGVNNMKKQKMKENAKKYIWDIENLSLNAAYFDETRKDSLTEFYIRQKWNINPIYRYNPKPLNFMPFKNIVAFKSPFLQLIRDFNLSPFPTAITLSANLERGFTKTKLRGKDKNSFVAPLFEKYFRLNRTVKLGWQLTKSIQINYTNEGYSIIDEPFGDLNTEVKRDSVWRNILSGGRLKLMKQQLSTSYRIPFDKFPLTQFIDTQLQHNSNYQWTASPINLKGADGIPLGGIMTIDKNFTLASKLSLAQIYNKVKILKQANTPQRNSVPPLKNKIDRLQLKINRLYDKETNIKDRNKDLLEKDIAKRERMEEQIFKIQEKIQKYQDKIGGFKNKQRALLASGKVPSSFSKQTLQSVFRLLTALKSVSFNYKSTLTSSMPGLDKPVSFFDFSTGWHIPRIPFSSAEAESLLRKNALERSWITKSESQLKPFNQSFNQSYNLQFNLQPLKQFSVILSFEKNRMNSYSEILQYDLQSRSFQSLTPGRRGSYKISFMPINTSFLSDNAQNISPPFETFVKNREVIRSRLTSLNTNDGVYELNSQDVMIPAFLAAYTGGNASSYSLNQFPELPLPNWKVQYTIPILKRIFSSLSLSHSYSSTYEVGNYSSSLQYLSHPDFFNLSLSENDIPLPLSFDDTRLFIPILLVNHVIITERFAPLVGVRVNTTSNMRFSFNYNRSRNIALNLVNSQVTDQANQDITIQFGFIKSNMKIPFRIKGLYKRLPNEVGFNIAFTLRDSKTVQRKILENDTENTVTAGSLTMQFRPNITYRINKYLNTLIYFEYNLNDPRVSNAFKRTISRGGFQFIFSITE